MKITMEPTDKIQTINGEPCRLWKGTTDAGTAIHVYVRCVQAQTDDPVAIEALTKELRLLPEPRRELVSFDLRMVM